MRVLEDVSQIVKLSQLNLKSLLNEFELSKERVGSMF